MPRKSYREKHREELNQKDRERYRKKHEKELEKRELEDPKPMKDKFMSWEQFHEMFPQLTFRDYFERRTDYERPIPRPTATPKDVKGGDFWHDSTEDREARDERIAGKLLSDVLSDDRPQSQQPQETSKNDMNDILAGYDAQQKKKRKQRETDSNKDENND